MLTKKKKKRKKKRSQTMYMLHEPTILAKANQFIVTVRDLLLPRDEGYGEKGRHRAKRKLWG